MVVCEGDRSLGSQVWILYPTSSRRAREDAGHPQMLVSPRIRESRCSLSDAHHNPRSRRFDSQPIANAIVGSLAILVFRQFYSSQIWHLANAACPQRFFFAITPPGCSRSSPRAKPSATLASAETTQLSLSVGSTGSGTFAAPPTGSTPPAPGLPGRSKGLHPLSATQRKKYSRTSPIHQERISSPHRATT